MTPQTATELAKLLKEAGLPDGVYNVIHGYGFETGQSLVEHPSVDCISFTGSTKAGRAIKKAVGDQLRKKVSLELGGKNPTIIFEDCDFDKTVESTVWAGFRNQGQICLCGSRILVEKSIYKKFVDAYVGKVKSDLILGDPNDPKTSQGALISIQHRDRVKGFIDRAKLAGGIIQTGGEIPKDLSPKGAFLQPTIITDLPTNAEASREEIFGPVVVIHSFDTIDDAIEIANQVEYGLAASVWTQNPENIIKVSEKILAGIVWHNCWMNRDDLSVPFGGMKDSGIGREGGSHSLDFYSELQSIVVALP